MPSPNRNLPLLILSAALLSVCSVTMAFGQDNTPPPSPTQPQSAPAPDSDDGVVGAEVDRLHKTVAQNSAEAWDMLTTAAADPKHPDIRIQALAALGTLGSNARAATLIVAAMKDPDVDVRTASVLAAGQTKNRNLTTNLRTMLDDKEPQVAFAAATTLWKMNDHSGEDILLAIVNGDRRATAGLKDSTLHTVSRDLHSPSTLARIAALQGASMLLGPFGIGITAYEYMRKNGGNSSRVIAIEQVGQEKTSLVRSTFIAALGDKDPSVRAAAAKQLGDYRGTDVTNALLPVFSDPKRPVRLTAAAAYLHSTEPAVRPASRKH